MFPDLTRDDIFRLETERLWLRWPRASDAAAITAFASLPEVAQMTAAIPHPYPAGEADRFIFNARAENAAGKALHFALTRKNGAARPSSASSRAIIAAPGEIELGYIIAPEMWGEGYASEAVRIAHRHRVRADRPRRGSSPMRGSTIPARARVLEKCGFVYIDSGLDLLPARGGLHPCDRFELDPRRNGGRPTALRTLPAMAHQAPTTPC